MSPLFFDIYLDGLMKEVKVKIERMGVRSSEDGKEWRLPGFFYS